MALVHSPKQLLDLPALLAQLVRDGLISRQDANEIGSHARTREEVLQHPLIYIAGQQPDNKLDSGKVLDLDTLSQWFADWVDLPLVHIDPLKINVASVTAVMSPEFARRHGILCIDVTADEVVVAVTQPFAILWVADIEQISGKTVHRVVANPADIEKYSVEFYTLSRSVFGAGK
ncbi:MAG: type II/IV secretion system protein, partial [Gammaproteobacteria bacterium]